MEHIPDQPPVRRMIFRFMGAGIAAALTRVALGQSKGKAKGHDKAAGKPGKHGPGPIFSAQDRLSIYAYVRDTPGFLPAEVRALPPGLARNLQRGKPLPPGWRKKISGFPPGLEQRLPALPAGYRRVVVDRWAFVIAEATHTVLDIIDLVKNQ